MSLYCGALPCTAWSDMMSCLSQFPPVRWCLVHAGIGVNCLVPAIWTCMLAHCLSMAKEAQILLDLTRGYIIILSELCPGRSSRLHSCSNIGAWLLHMSASIISFDISVTKFDLSLLTGERVVLSASCNFSSVGKVGSTSYCGP